MQVFGIGFDVEGTLIDCVPNVLRSWREVLQRNGHPVAASDLQRCSGMNSHGMLQELLPDLSEADCEALIGEQGKHYSKYYLKKAEAFPSVRSTMEFLKRSGLRIALTTDTTDPCLSHYRGMIDVDDYLDAVASGEGCRGKPYSDIVMKAARKLDLPSECLIIVGDTPSDAGAAAAAGARCIGVTTGGFSERHLLDAGCYAVAKSIGDLESILHTVIDNSTAGDDRRTAQPAGR